MVNLVSKLTVAGVVFIGVAYQFVFKSLIFGTLGYGRKVLSIKDFNHFQCEKIEQPDLEGCEHMWLHEPTGYLYMACSDSKSRTNWLPAADYLDAAQRGLNDRIGVLDTRGAGSFASRFNWLSVENFSGNQGDGTLNLHGFDVLADKRTNILRILLINHRPPFDAVTGAPLDASKVGANSTIEQFQTKAGSSSMRHVRTYAHDLIQTPNQVAWVSDHSFVYTNDHSGKTGLRRHFDIFLGGGNVGYCDRNRCKIAYSGFKGPNGLVRSDDGLIYLPSTITGLVDVLSVNEDRSLYKEDTIDVGLPIDNLSIDKNGDIYVAALPQVHRWIVSSKNPLITPPSTVFRIKRSVQPYKGKSRREALQKYEGDYVVEKVLEDDGSLLPGATVAVHDVQMKKMYLSGIMAPFITICDMP